MNDEILWQCNETELLWMARRQGIGFLRRGLTKQELIEIVAGYKNPEPHHLSETGDTRRRLEGFISENWGVLRSQLPQCTGKCQTFRCTEGKHALCFYPNAERLVTG